MQIKYLLIYSTLSGENGLLLSLTTRRSSTKYAIFPASFAAFNFGINGSRFCRVERAMSSVMKRPLGFSLRTLRRTCSFCFQSRNLHTMVRGLLESDWPLLPGLGFHMPLCALSISMSTPSLFLTV